MLCIAKASGWDYSLVDQRADADSMWFLDCSDAKDKVIWRLQMVATTGVVFSQEVFERVL